MDEAEAAQGLGAVSAAILTADMLRADTLLTRLSSAAAEVTVTELSKTVPLYTSALSQVRGNPSTSHPSTSSPLPPTPLPPTLSQPQPHSILNSSSTSLYIYT